jgi:hypothetical protein
MTALTPRRVAGKVGTKAMIWFSCKQCGKVHGRPETAAGATIFCDCGAGVFVPWESTMPEPSAALEVADVPAAPALAPITFDAPPSRRGPTARGRKRGRLTRRDPRFCFNHDQVARHGACADCGESFCADCLATFAGSALCAPCKNVRAKTLLATQGPSKLSILCLVSAFATSSATALLPVGRAGFPWWMLLAIVAQGLVAALAILALRTMDRSEKASGRALALTGLVSAGVTCAFIMLMTMYVPRHWS